MRIFLLTYVSMLLCGCYSKNVKSETAIRVPSIALPNAIQTIMHNLEYQVQHTHAYDPAYIPLNYPNGDVPIEKGVCADVIVRALRSKNIDLQKEVHDDMDANFSVYPNKWNLSRPDKNIDHRRVPNLMTFFERKGKARVITNLANDYLPGDIVVWKLPNNLYHIGMVSSDVNELGVPIVIHNIGSGTRKADVLFNWKIIGHYRWFE